jgi:hypothetical protein
MSSSNYSTYESINEFINEFLKDNSDSKKLNQAWNEKSNQKEFKALMLKFKNVKKSKDPSAPKAAKSAYAFFSQDKRQEVKDKNLGIEPKDMFTFFSQEWKALKEKTDKKSLAKVKAYEEMATKDKVRYAEEMEDYEPTEGYEKKEKKVKVQKPRSSYLIYSAEKREETKKTLLKENGENPSSTLIMKEIAKKWKELKEKAASKNKKAIEELEKYTEMAKEEKERLSPPKDEEDEDEEREEEDEEQGTPPDFKDDCDEEEEEEKPKAAPKKVQKKQPKAKAVSKKESEDDDEEKPKAKSAPKIQKTKGKATPKEEEFVDSDDE